MEQLLRLTVICIISVGVSLLIKKNQPEFSFILGTCTAIFSLYCVFKLYQQLDQYFMRWKSLISVSTDYFIPLLKCFGISVISQFGVNLCKDAGHSAVACGLELCGNLAAVCCVLPLINHLFSLIEDLL